ncbi:MAG: hypothetical protein Q7T73_03330 [Beijerinckiaceae bacterium]|nr:hypothetical protein [Beijerinckiaceae bacterium]
MKGMPTADREQLQKLREHYSCKIVLAAATHRSIWKEQPIVEDLLAIADGHPLWGSTDTTSIELAASAKKDQPLTAFELRFLVRKLRQIDADRET